MESPISTNLTLVFIIAILVICHPVILYYALEWLDKREHRKACEDKMDVALVDKVLEV